ncbi:MAG: NifU family protein [Geodermatophilaceae bacterium]|nr:NifU family protein [Geodermatophilaceae bacterium]
MSTGTKDFRQVGGRIEELLGGLAENADAQSLHAAEEAVRLLVEMYGAALETVVDALQHSDGGDKVLQELTGDDLVTSLLIVHGLHPVPLMDRISEALDSVRPYLGSHAGGVEVIGVDDDGVLQLRLQGSCDGCSSSSETVRVAIENAVLAAAPEIVAVEAEGMVEKPKKTELLQIQPYRSAEPDPEPADGGGWKALADPPVLGRGEVAGVDLDGVAVLLIRTDTQRYAYRNRCAACAAALDEATMDGSVLQCPACTARFDLAVAGRPVDVTGAQTSGDQLEPLPLLADGQGVRIAVPEGAMR